MRHSREEKSIFWADSLGPVRVPEPRADSCFPSLSPRSCTDNLLPPLQPTEPAPRPSAPAATYVVWCIDPPPPHLHRCLQAPLPSAGEESKAAVKTHTLPGLGLGRPLTPSPKFPGIPGQGRGWGGLNHNVPGAPKPGKEGRRLRRKVGECRAGMPP